MLTKSQRLAQFASHCETSRNRNVTRAQVAPIVLCESSVSHARQVIMLPCDRFSVIDPFNSQLVVSPCEHGRLLRAFAAVVCGQLTTLLENSRLPRRVV